MRTLLWRTLSQMILALVRLSRVGGLVFKQRLPNKNVTDIFGNERSQPELNMRRQLECRFSQCLAICRGGRAGVPCVNSILRALIKPAHCSVALYALNSE